MKTILKIHQKLIEVVRTNNEMQTLLRDTLKDLKEISNRAWSKTIGIFKMHFLLNMLNMFGFINKVIPRKYLEVFSFLSPAT